MVTYQFECMLLVIKIIKSAKKAGVKSCFKAGFEFQGKYFICLEKCLKKVKVKENSKRHYYKCLVIESSEGGLWRIPLLKKDPGAEWWPDLHQVPNKEVINILKKLYTFLKA